MFTCTTRINERSEVAEQVLELPAVIEVVELMTGQRNLLIKAVGVVDEDITHVAERVDDLDIEIHGENLIWSEHTKPLDFVEVADSFDRE